MFTEEFKKACEACKTEEELKAVIELHKSELTDEELQQVAGGVVIIGRLKFNPQWGDFTGSVVAERDVI